MTGAVLAGTIHSMTTVSASTNNPGVPEQSAGDHSPESHTAWNGWNEVTCSECGLAWPCPTERESV